LTTKTAKYLDQSTEHVDVSDDKGLYDLLMSFSRASFQARNLSRCFEVYQRMLMDEQAVIYFGLAGALVPAGMRKIIVDLMKNHFIDVLVSTGANLFHDFFEALGYHHYIGDSYADDSELCRAKVNRIYDTYMSDIEFSKAEKKIAQIAAGFEQRVYSSREFLERLGSEIDDSGSILFTAKKEGIPVFCPALCDSAIGIALTHHYIQSKSGSRLIIDQIRDNFEILQIMNQATRTGAFYLGGGVPKNYIQQLNPMHEAYGSRKEGHKYFVQLTTDDPKFGGLSGCTSSEAEAWGKVAADNFSAGAYVDATIGLPLIAGAVFSYFSGRLIRKKRNFCWKGDVLEGLKIE
jgi:deoxyhypusine synthase